MKTLLSIDCSTGPTSIALLQNGEVIAHAEDNAANEQSKKLVNAIDALVREHLEDYSSLDAIVVTTGPGRFTSIRIALATARGLSLAADVPIIAISSLEAIAWEQLHDQSTEKTTQAIINAHRGQVYAQSFKRMEHGMEALDEAALLDAEDSQNLQTPNATFAGLFALTLPESKQQNRPAEAFYIRPPDAKPQSSLV